MKVISLFSIFDFRFPILYPFKPNPKSEIKIPKSTEQAVNILVCNFGEERILVQTMICRISRDVLEDRGDLVTRFLGAEFHQSERRTLVEDHDQEAPSDDADENALAFTLVDDTRKNVLSDEFGHRARRRDISGRERRKTRRVHVADIAVERDRLTVPVNEKHHSRRALDTQPHKDAFDLLKLMFVNDSWRFDHLKLGSLDSWRKRARSVSLSETRSCGNYAEQAGRADRPATFII